MSYTGMLSSVTAGCAAAPPITKAAKVAELIVDVATSPHQHFLSCSGHRIEPINSSERDSYQELCHTACKISGISHSHWPECSFICLSRRTALHGMGGPVMVQLTDNQAQINLTLEGEAAICFNPAAVVIDMPWF